MLSGKDSENELAADRTSVPLGPWASSTNTASMFSVGTTPSGSTANKLSEKYSDTLCNTVPPALVTTRIRSPSSNDRPPMLAGPLVEMMNSLLPRTCRASMFSLGKALLDSASNSDSEKTSVAV